MEYDPPYRILNNPTEGEIVAGLPSGSNPLAVAVLRFSAAGDIILASAFVRALRQRFPEARIVFFTRREFVGLVEHSPWISAVAPVERRWSAGELRAFARAQREEVGGRFDLVYDLHNSLRSRALRRVLGGRLRVVGKPSLRKRWMVLSKQRPSPSLLPVPELYLAAGARDGLRDDGAGLELFTGTARPPVVRLGTRPSVALCPGAQHFTKRWPPERFASLAVALWQRHNVRVVVLGGPDDRGAAAMIDEAVGGVGGEVVNLAGRTSFPETALAIDACDVVVAGDSVLGHIAAARGRPVVSIFGSTVPEFGFAPWRVQSTIVEVHSLPCRPCTTKGRERCPLGHFRCMLDIDVENVLGTVERSIRL